LTNFWNKEVGKNKQRKYIKDIAKLWLGKDTMSKQAKTLNNDEIRKVLYYVATRKHSERNRAMIYTIFNTGMRVSEVANLRFKDVVDGEGAIRREIRLGAEDTKTKEARIVFVNDKLHKELTRYVKLYKPLNINVKFFYSQKRASDGYSPNTLAQFFHYLFNRAGIAGASSHSGRRSFITNLANKGVGVRVIMGLSGHRALSSVQCYIDCNDDMKRKAINLLN
jgi:integrase/recombinase XerD